MIIIYKGDKLKFELQPSVLDLRTIQTLKYNKVLIILLL